MPSKDGKSSSGTSRELAITSQPWPHARRAVKKVPNSNHETIASPRAADPRVAVANGNSAPALAVEAESPCSLGPAWTLTHGRPRGLQIGSMMFSAATCLPFP